MKRTLLLCALVAILTALPSQSRSQTDIGFRGIGGHIGLVDPENLGATVGIGAFADLGTLTERLLLQGNLDFWSRSEDFGVLEQRAEWSFRDIALGATAAYFFSEPEVSFQPYAGGGLALHFLRSSYDNHPNVIGGSFSDTDTKLGIDLTAGARFGTAERIRWLGEFRYRVVSDFNQLALRGGMVYLFPN